jgi:hypothetical protein
VRGADLEIAATLVGFDSENAEVVVKTGVEGSWERWPMSPGEQAREFSYMFLDLGGEVEFFVEASGVRSPLRRIDVMDLPYVERLALEYHFPAYTGLEPQRVEEGGDIAAVVGTEVRLEITPTIATAAGRLVIEGQPPQDLLPHRAARPRRRFASRLSRVHDRDTRRSAAGGPFRQAGPRHARQQDRRGVRRGGGTG